MNEFEVTKPKLRRKRVRLVGERIVVIHLQKDGKIYYYEMKTVSIG